MPLDGLRRFDHPTLLLWGGNDPHFGPPWAERLATDIPGVQRVEILANAGHLLMEDQPRMRSAQRYLRHVGWTDEH